MDRARAEPCGVLLLDKPAGYSSTQALGRAKRLLAAPKAGHTGTLDPFATGLLPLAFGEATKFSRFLIDAPKSYQALLVLGEETATGDTEGDVIARCAPETRTDRIDEVLRRFMGAQDQTPPMHSAVRVKGRRLYEYARAGQAVERPVRRIAITRLERLAFEGPLLTLAVSCSKGTYIRTLAMDIGQALGCGAHLRALRRTATGPFGIDAACTLDQLEHEGMERARLRLLPMDILVAGVARAEVSAEIGWRFRNGQEVPHESAPEGSEWALFEAGGAFLGIARAPRAGVLAPERVVASPVAAAAGEIT
ncbi:MAG TPA: tRNA pseudouridine(55) synthase TruB [Usitatibacter sp.]|jgi:tRNA pseudouridine55 synthase|nr:tRNA pseudouridine(55) synthase TruB [Usitatibacter sp.]